MHINDENTHLYNHFYRGKVINNQDPQNSQRVQVRILGLHSQNKNGSLGDKIPDNELPWAEQAELFLNGSYVPAVNDYVWLFMENGNFMKPVYFAKCRKANDTSVESDNIEKMGQPRDDDTVEIEIADMRIKSAKSIHGRKIEIQNLESGGIIKIDRFNQKSRIILSADLIEIDGDIGAGKGMRGYPLLTETPSTTISINGVPLRSSRGSYG